MHVKLSPSEVAISLSHLELKFGKLKPECLRIQSEMCVDPVANFLRINSSTLMLIDGV